MHSRIFQISKSPIPEYDRIDEDALEGYDSSFYDYVDCLDTQDDVSRLTGQPGLELVKDETGVAIVVASREQFFARSFDAFRQAIQEAAKWTLSEFSAPVAEMVEFRIREAFNSKFSFYVFEHGGIGLMPLGEFVRHCDEGARYYVGTVLDYHF